MDVRAVAAATLFLFPLALLAADTNPAPSDDTTPLGLIRSQTAVISAGGSTIARARMSVVDAKYASIADTLAALQSSSAKLNAAVAAQWGATVATDLSHALGSVAATDADTATVTIEANHADIHWKNATTPTHFLLVDGHWKYDVDRNLQSMDARALALTESYYKNLAPQVDALYQHFLAGDYKSADDFLRHARLAAAKVEAAMQSQ